VICKRFEISRKTGYKWLARYEEGGHGALVDGEPVPRRCRHATPSAVVDAVIEARKAHPFWGPKKLRSWLSEREPRRASRRACVVGSLPRYNGGNQVASSEFAARGSWGKDRAPEHAHGCGLPPARSSLCRRGLTGPWSGPARSRGASRGTRTLVVLAPSPPMNRGAGLVDRSCPARDPTPPTPLRNPCKPRAPSSESAPRNRFDEGGAAPPPSSSPSPDAFRAGDGRGHLAHLGACT
jgi:hypothetical protein